MKNPELYPPLAHEPVTQERLKEWYEVTLRQITPASRARAEAIVNEIKTTDVDIEQGEMAKKIDVWIQEAVNEVDPVDLHDSRGDDASFEAEAWMYFQSLRESKE